MRLLCSISHNKIEVLLRLQTREVSNLPHVSWPPAASEVTDEAECINFLTKFLSWRKNHPSKYPVMPSQVK